MLSASCGGFCTARKLCSDLFAVAAPLRLPHLKFLFVCFVSLSYLLGGCLCIWVCRSLEAIVVSLEASDGVKSLRPSTLFAIPTPWTVACWLGCLCLDRCNGVKLVLLSEQNLNVLTGTARPSHRMYRVLLMLQGGRLRCLDFPCCFRLSHYPLA